MRRYLVAPMHQTRGRARKLVTNKKQDMRVYVPLAANALLPTIVKMQENAEEQDVSISRD